LFHAGLFPCWGGSSQLNDTTSGAECFGW
jgi:hypothetical protein